MRYTIKSLNLFSIIYITYVPKIDMKTLYPKHVYTM